MLVVLEAVAASCCAYCNSTNFLLSKQI